MAPAGDDVATAFMSQLARCWLVHRRYVAFVLLVALALPLVSAQTTTGALQAQLNIFVLDPGGALPPGQESAVPLKLNYQLPDGAQAEFDPATAVEGPGTRPSIITLEVVEKPDWVVAVRFEPTQIVVPLPPEETADGPSIPLDAIAYVTLAPDAPALDRAPFSVRASAPANGNIGAAEGTSTATPIRPAVVPLFNVTSERATWIIPGGSWTVVPFRVTNLGNANIAATVNVTVAPEYSQVEFPKTLTLGPGESTIIEVRVRTPWTEREVGGLILEVTPLPEEGEAQPVAHEVTVQGESAVPPAPFAALIGAVLGVALLRRRHRA